MQTTHRSASPTARALGYAGLIPFIAGAAWTWAARGGAGADSAAFALAAYAATIVSFLGGVHWGGALRDDGQHPAALAWGVAPQLAAWLALLLPPRPALALLALLLGACWLVDRRLYPRAGLASWLPMRLRLTAGAMASCLAAAAAAA